MHEKYILMNRPNISGDYKQLSIGEEQEADQSYQTPLSVEWAVMVTPPSPPNKSTNNSSIQHVLILNVALSTAQLCSSSL